MATPVPATPANIGPIGDQARDAASAPASDPVVLVDCLDCHGEGELDCRVCGGDGALTGCESCTRGAVPCGACDGNGRIPGPTCGSPWVDLAAGLVWRTCTRPVDAAGDRCADHDRQHAYAVWRYALGPAAPTSEARSEPRSEPREGVTPGRRP